MGPDRVVHLSGEIDLDTKPELSKRLTAALGDLREGECLLIDLAAVEFIDSTGLGCIAAAVRDAEGMGHSVALRAPRPGVHRVLEIVGMAGLVRSSS